MSCSVVQERYQPKPMAANSSLKVSKQSIGGFLCITSGTVSVEDYNGIVLVDKLPVTAGVYHPIPIYLGQHGGEVVLAGGASGTLCV